MRLTQLSLILTVCLGLAMLAGCNSELKDLKSQNDSLQSQLQTCNLELDKSKRELSALQGQGSVESETLKQKIAALEQDIEKKKALIASMQQQLISGGVQLPPELNTMLEEFAKGKEMVTYDASRGLVKFKSDLLFEPGSDIVAPAAAEAIKSLSGILNSEQGKQFDVIIAGHTDDLRISKPETREKHPTNWHLSAHRAIAVLDLMEKDGIVPERMSVRGFGEFRPFEENQPEKKGNPQNRRVEIYIVPKGV